MTRYLIKYTWAVNPFLIESNNHYRKIPNGLYMAWFREFLSDMHEVEWVRKV